MQDPAVSNAMVSFLEPLVQSVLPNATATDVVLNNFTVRLHVKACRLLPDFCIPWLLFVCLTH
jgi:hypothetical protein